MSANPLIVVVGYKRDKAIRRLLNSLSKAIYPEVGVRIVISLDGGYSEKVFIEAEKFKDEFRCGSVEIVARQLNLGLREHILWCGDQAKQTGSVIVLEDDLYVDPQFYIFALSALKFYAEDIKIAGVALYSPEHNEYAKMPFSPLNSNFSVYFMQVACSWGQMWSVNQWAEFRKWLIQNDMSSAVDAATIPDAVKAWPESSWKKYFSAYLASCGKYFVYPYRTYATNVSDPGGTHVIGGTSIFQTNLAIANRGLDKYNFQSSDDELAVVYDSFMEPKSKFLFDLIGYGECDIEIDFYGIKPIELLRKKSYSLTIRNVDFPMRTYRMSFKPFEHSIVHDFNHIKGVELKISQSTAVIDKISSPNYIFLMEYLTGAKILTSKFLRSIISVSFEKVAKYLFR